MGGGGAVVIKWSGKASNRLRHSNSHKPCDYLEEDTSRKDIQGRRNCQSNRAGNSKLARGCGEHSKGVRGWEMRWEGRQGLTKQGEAFELHPHEMGNYLIQTAISSL